MTALMSMGYWMVGMIDIPSRARLLYISCGRWTAPITLHPGPDHSYGINQRVKRQNHHFEVSLPLPLIQATIRVFVVVVH